MNSRASAGNFPGVDLAPYRNFMIELAQHSGAFLRPLFADPRLAVEAKSDQTPVTAADRGAEELMRGLIAGRFSAHGIIGEEFGSDRPEAEFTWVLDPVDGTKSFISGVPLWGTLIALLHQGKPVLGCIHQPILDQLLVGDGTVTTMNGHPVRCRSVNRLGDATLLTSSPMNFCRESAGRSLASLASQARLVRAWGDCYGYLLVATGRADVMMDPEMHLWDIAALVPVIRGAGGVITDWQGKDPYPAKSCLAAGTSDLHAAILAGLQA